MGVSLHEKVAVAIDFGVEEHADERRKAGESPTNCKLFCAFDEFRLERDSRSNAFAARFWFHVNANLTRNQKLSIFDFWGHHPSFLFAAKQKLTILRAWQTNLCLIPKRQNRRGSRCPRN